MSAQVFETDNCKLKILYKDDEKTALVILTGESSSVSIHLDATQLRLLASHVKETANIIEDLKWKSI